MLKLSTAVPASRTNAVGAHATRPAQPCVGPHEQPTVSEDSVSVPGLRPGKVLARSVLRSPSPRNRLSRPGTPGTEPRPPRTRVWRRNGPGSPGWGGRCLGTGRGDPRGGPGPGLAGLRLLRRCHPCSASAPNRSSTFRGHPDRAPTAPGDRTPPRLTWPQPRDPDRARPLLPRGRGRRDRRKEKRRPRGAEPLRRRSPRLQNPPRGRQGAPPPGREGQRERGRGSRAPGVPAGLGAPAPGVPGPSWGCFPAAAAPGAAAASPRPGLSTHRRLRARSGPGPGRGCCGAGHRLRPRRARVPCPPGAAPVAALTVPARGGRSRRARTGGDAVSRLYRAASGSRDVAGRGKREKPGKSGAEPGPFRPLAPHRWAPVRAGGTGRCPVSAARSSGPCPARRQLPGPGRVLPLPAGSGCCSRPLPGPQPRLSAGGSCRDPRGTPSRRRRAAGPGFPGDRSCRRRLRCLLRASGPFPSPHGAGPPVGARLGPGDVPSGFRHRPSGVPSRGAAAAARPVGPGVPSSSRIRPQDQPLLPPGTAVGAPLPAPPARPRSQAGLPSHLRTRRRGAAGRARRLLPLAAGRSRGAAAEGPSHTGRRPAKNVLQCEQRPLQGPAVSPAAPSVRGQSRPGQAWGAAAVLVLLVPREVSVALAMLRGRTCANNVWGRLIPAPGQQAPGGCRPGGRARWVCRWTDGRTEERQPGREPRGVWSPRRKPG
ncbi:uncharacterized protein LOC141922146 [Strix aluco]|uniref:uncharacterized protein LOC141922146 n=1 Tax=Strix aluco TaxID=111821 RepID=UPI003DA66487